MNIAEITPVFPPYKGGIGMVALQNTLQLQDVGHTVEVYTPSYIHTQSIEDEHPHLSIHRIRPWIQYGNAAFVPSLFLALKSFDRIHLHYPFIGGAESALLAKIVFGKKLLVTYHMDLVGTGLRALFFRVYSFFMVPLVVSCADTIFVTSMDYARHSKLLRFLEKNKKKIVELPIGVDIKHFSPRAQGEDSVRTRYALEKNERVLLFVGGLDSAHYFKGINILLDAVKYISENNSFPLFRVVVVGDGDLRQSYEDSARDLGLQKRVIFTGSISQQDLPSYIRSADACVLPSVDSSEAFGIVLLEAMACGVPVIATDLPGVRSVVRHGENGLLVPPRDSHALAAAIQELFCDEEKRKRYGIRGREIVETFYSGEAVRKQLISSL